MADLVLVIAETQEGTPNKITYEMLTAAQEVAGTLEYNVARRSWSATSVTRPRAASP